MNRTPVSGGIEAARAKRDIDAYGCGLAHTLARAPPEIHFAIQINLITPFMPITSDGKEPNLRPFLNQLTAAVTKAVRKAHKPIPEPDDSSLLPKRRRGRQSPEAEDAYREKVEAFCKLIRQIHSSLDFGVGSRDYCYLLDSMAWAKVTLTPPRS